MNIPKYTEQYAKELRRRNFSENTVKNYVSCIALFLSKMTKEHPLHVNEGDIKNYLGTFTEPNTQRSSHSSIKRFYEICLGQKDKTTQGYTHISNNLISKTFSPLQNISL